ncbi:hypothetical protein R1sor_003215 [Riccia sorocarpa]|uniref:BRCT domain-containing protein n=1 Tax=Riccia sorocarpa TaxID=122646 RepID=A0ABD3H1R6_9MARC
MLADGIRDLRFTLLNDKKSKSGMWWFLEKCHNHEIDVKALGKVLVSVIFKKTDKAFNFEMYMESKGMKVKAAETGEASQPESSKKKKSKKSLDSTKKTSEAEKSKKTKMNPVNTSSDVEAIKKTKSIQATTASSGQKKGDTSTAHVPRTEAAPSLNVGGPSNNAAPSTPVIDPQPADCNIIRPAWVGEDGSVNMSTLDDAQKSKNQQEVAVMEVTDDEEKESSSKSRKRKAVAKVEKPVGFKPGQTVAGLDQEAKGVKINGVPAMQSAARSRDSKLDGCAWIVGVASVPYEMYTGKKKCINILKLEDLKSFIKKGGKFMVISGLHSMKDAKNIILEVGQNKEHVLYGRADQLKKRHIKIVRGDTPESVLCKL